MLIGRRTSISEGVKCKVRWFVCGKKNSFYVTGILVRDAEGSKL